jgi:hypothetical protein
MHGYSQFNNQFFRHFIAAACEEAMLEGGEVPEGLVMLDLLGPRHAAFANYSRTVAGRKVQLRRGEALLAYGIFGKLYGWKKSRAQRFLNRMVRIGFLARVSDEKKAGTVYRLNHFEKLRDGARIDRDLLQAWDVHRIRRKPSEPQRPTWDIDSDPPF